MKRIPVLTTLTALVALWTIMLGAFIPSEALGAVPQLINFQGILRDGSGNPVADGSYFVTFRIYNVPAGGTVMWGDTQTVVTSSGLFNAVLGRGTPVPDTVFNDSVRYVGVQVFPDPEMTPRQRLTTSGYSFRSTEWASVGNNIYRLNGNVGIGTATPGAKLDVDGGIIRNFYSHTNDMTPSIYVRNGASALTPGTFGGWGIFSSVHSDGPESKFGILGNAGGSQGTKYGIFGSAVGGGTNWAGYFVGNVGISERLGIAEFTPINRLDVEGGAAIGSSYSGTNTAPSNGLIVEGNVGIGTSSPITRLEVEMTAGTPVWFDRLTNDGPVVWIAQDNVGEGNISVAGNTVSYNAFTGSHYGWTEEVLERGELVTLTGANRNAHDNPKSEVIYGVKRSTVPNDPACLGSYLGLQESGQPAGSENPHLVMAVGNGDMWVVDAGENIQPGDYLISSRVPGHAMKDDEANYPIGHVVARAAEAVDWSGASEMVGGIKHKKISVLFESSVRTGTGHLTKAFEQQQKQIEELKAEIWKLKNESPQAKVEN